MKRLVLVSVLVASGCAGRIPAAASPPLLSGWIDFVRVHAESSLGKRIAEEDRIFIGSRQQEVEKIGAQFEAAEKAKDRDIDAKRAVAQQKVRQFQAEAKAREDQDVAQLTAAVKPIADALRAERHLSRIEFEQHLSAEGDLTDEVIRRLDAGDTRGMAEELARTKAENERLKGATVKTTKPELPNK